MADGYALLDVGDGRRLERFGERIVDRPAPAATGPRQDPDSWTRADARFAATTAGGSWTTGSHEPWTVTMDGLRFELRLAAGGQVGLFPEHLQLRPWLEERVADAQATATDAGSDAASSAPRVLHLFAYTGALTLALARSGAAVAHVDSSRTAVAWARRNAALSGVAECPVRWLVDDARDFVRREERRGRAYAGVVLDPPSYGHGPGGAWRLEDDLPDLVSAVGRLVAAEAAFVLVTAHARDLEPDALADVVAAALPNRGSFQSGRLALTSETGAVLPAGVYVQWRGDAS